MTNEKSEIPITTTKSLILLILEFLERAKKGEGGRRATGGGGTQEWRNVGCKTGRWAAHWPLGVTGGGRARGVTGGWPSPRRDGRWPSPRRDGRVDGSHCGWCESVAGLSFKDGGLVQLRVRDGSLTRSPPRGLHQCQDRRGLSPAALPRHARRRAERARGAARRPRRGNYLNPTPRILSVHAIGVRCEAAETSGRRSRSRLLG